MKYIWCIINVIYESLCGAECMYSVHLLKMRAVNVKYMLTIVNVKMTYDCSNVKLQIVVIIEFFEVHSDFVAYPGFSPLF